MHELLFGWGSNPIPEFNEIIFQSDFIKRCADVALHNDLIKEICEKKSEFLVLDLAEERIPKAFISGGKNEIAIAKHAFFRPLTDLLEQGKLAGYSLRNIRFNALDWEKVEDAYVNFAGSVKQVYSQQNIIIIEVYMAKRLINKEFYVEEFGTDNSGFSQEYINLANEYIRKCYTLLEKLFPLAKIIRIPDNCLCPYYHRWGLNPLHYTSSVYEYLIESMNVLTGNSNCDTTGALYQELKMKNEILRRGLIRRSDD